MRILALIPSSFYGDTDDAVNERQLLEKLSERIDKLIVFSRYHMRKNRRSTPPNTVLIGLLSLPYFGLITQIFYSFIVSAVARILDRFYRFDLIYIRGPLLALGFMLNKRVSKKCVVKYPCFLEDELKIGKLSKKIVGKAFYIIDRIVLSNCRKIAVPSRGWIPEILQKRRVSRAESSYLLLPAGFDPKKISGIKNKVENKQKEKYFQIGFLGSLMEWQGVDTLIKAVALLRERIDNLHLVIIGDGPLRPLIEKMCITYELSYEITGFLPHEEALTRLGTLDIMVLPRRRTSSTELNIPIKVVEAWALGVPVIVTKHRVFLDNQIKDYEDVIYCEPEPYSVADAIFTLLTNNELRKKLQTNGPKLARQFDYSELTERLLKA